MGGGQRQGPEAGPGTTWELGRTFGASGHLSTPRLQVTLMWELAWTGSPRALGTHFQIRTESRVILGAGA